MTRRLVLIFLVLLVLAGCGPSYVKWTRKRKKTESFTVWVNNTASFTRGFVVYMDGAQVSNQTPIPGGSFLGFRVERFLPAKVEVELLGGAKQERRLGIDYQFWDGGCTVTF